MTAIRPAAVAGQFYPADPTEARRAVAAFLDAAAGPVPPAPGPKAIIVPHAGWVYSAPVAAAAYARLAPSRGRIHRVVLLGPAHRLALRGLALSGAEAWATPLGPVMLDRDGGLALAGLPGISVLDQAHAQEHSLEVQLPFLVAMLDDFLLLPIVVGETPTAMVAAVIEAAWGGDETLVVVSTDLSHYLDYDTCNRTDAATAQAIERLDPAGIGRDAACGRVPLSGLLDAARRHGLSIETLSRCNSGDTAGPRGRVVGYGAWALYEGNRQ